MSTFVAPSMGTLQNIEYQSPFLVFKVQPGIEGCNCSCLGFLGNNNTIVNLQMQMPFKFDSAGMCYVLYYFGERLPLFYIVL